MPVRDTDVAERDEQAQAVCSYAVPCAAETETAATAASVGTAAPSPPMTNADMTVRRCVDYECGSRGDVSLLCAGCDGDVPGSVQRSAMSVAAV